MIGFETAALLLAGFAGGVGASRIYADRAAIWASMQKPQPKAPAAAAPLKRKPAKKGKGSIVVPANVVKFPAKAARKPAAKKSKRRTG